MERRTLIGRICVFLSTCVGGSRARMARTANRIYTVPREVITEYISRFVSNQQMATQCDARNAIFVTQIP